MNRFFQTAYYTIYIYLYVTIFLGIATGTEMPLPAFLCLFFGLMIAMAPDIFDGQLGRKTVFLALGLLVSLLGFLPIRLSDGIQMHYFGYGIGIVAGVLLYLFQRPQTSYYRFMEVFKRTVISASILIVLVLLFLLPVFIDGQIITFGQEELKTVANSTVPIIIMLLAVGVLHLRALRSLRGKIDRDAYRRRQLRDVLMFAALVAIVYVFEPFKFLAMGAAWLYESAILPILALIVKLFPNRIPDWFDFWQYRQEHIAENPDDIGAAQLSHDIHEVVPSDVVSDVVETNGNFQYIFVAILILIVVVVNYLLLRKRSYRKASLGYPIETVEKIEEDEYIDTQSTLKKRSLDPRTRIRHNYLDFLKYLGRRRLPLGDADTTGEIKEKSITAFPTDAETIDALSKLYDRARYQQSEAPSASDAKNMHELLKTFKRDR